MKAFPSIRIEGGLLGPDILDQLLAGELPGQHPTDFGLDVRRNLTDEIAAAFADARALWGVFKHRLERLPESDPGTSLTRDAWVIPFLGLLGYELRFNPRAYEVDGLTFAISHRAGEAEDAPPVHIVGARQELGRLAPTGRPRLAPHSLLQEFLNRTERLWGIVTNGFTLRLLRDSTYIRRQAYVEFNLADILDEQHFEDFVALYRLLHRTRLPRTTADANECLLERYFLHSVEQGGRVRDRLRDGVEECIKRLANGFLAHPNNSDLRQRIASREQRAVSSAEDTPLAPEDLYRQLLRLVYRFLFLLVSEDRGLISPNPLYREHYGISRLRRLVDIRSAYNDYDDIWHGLRVLWKVLSDEKLAPFLEVAPLNGELFAEIELDICSISNRDLLEAFWHLAYYQESPSSPPRRVNYGALDVEELGSVYESLLEYHPQIDTSGTVPRFELAPGSERKSTGSYYTPPELVAELIRSALEPVIAERLASSERRAESSDASELTLEEKRYVYSVISRPASVAERHGLSRASLPTDPVVSQGGTLRTDLANPPSRDIHSSEHRGRMGATDDRGIPPVPAQRPGQPSGIGNPSSAGTSVEPGNQRPDSTSVGNVPGAGAPTDQPSAQPFSEKAFLRIWQSLPLTARRSLLAEYSLLSIRVLDPACGSGHFLLAAARRLGKELAKIRTGEDEPAPERVREAIRDVVGHCIYGVDKNPLAVDLCRVALWLEAHCEGKPLTFLDHRIKCGDSLVGVMDLDVLKEGIPDEAFAPVSGDDRQVARSLKKRNQDQRAGQRELDFDGAIQSEPAQDSLRVLLETPDDTPEQIRQKAQALHEWEQQTERLRMACHLWTAAFFQKFLPAPSARGTATEGFITTETVRRYLESRTAHGQAVGLARALAQENRFFHWPLEFPEVFTASSEQPAASSEEATPLATRYSPLANTAGFDVVLSNPPWERIKLQEEEFFASRDAAIARAPNAAARKRMIADLPQTNPSLWQDYQRALHNAESTSRFLRGSGQYPLTGRGDINTYSVFAERVRYLLGPQGRAGIVVPTGIATDATNQFFFADLVEKGQLVSLFDFDNREKLFPAVISLMKFSLLTVAGLGDPERQISFAFFCHRPEDIRHPLKLLHLSSGDLARINPNTRTLPVFRTRQDADLTRAIYQRVPVLVKERTDENPWGVRFLRMLDMSNDSHLFRTRAELEAQGFRLVGNVFVKEQPQQASSEQRAEGASNGQASSGEDTPLATRHSPLANTAARHSPLATAYLPLYEAKMLWHYDHRYGTYEGVSDRTSTQLPTPDERQHADPHFVVQPWYWVPAEEVQARLGEWQRGWLLGFRNVTNATNERSAIFGLLPKVGVGHSMPLLFAKAVKTYLVPALVANLASIVFDYFVRQKIGGVNMTFGYIEQFPVLPPDAYTPEDLRFIVPRVLELVYTAWDMKPFADDVCNEADDPLRAAIAAQWEANRAATGGHPSDLPDWATAYPELTPLAAGRSLLASPCPFPPFHWDETRRAILRAELDAYYARLYGLTRKQLRYILDPADLTERELEDILDPWEEVDDPLDPQGYAARVAASTFPGETFRVLKEKEQRQYGEYRTRRLVLEVWENTVGEKRRCTPTPPPINGDSQ